LACRVFRAQKCRQLLEQDSYRNGLADTPSGPIFGFPSRKSETTIYERLHETVEEVELYFKCTSTEHSLTVNKESKGNAGVKNCNGSTLE
jgi:hypothetical protein